MSASLSLSLLQQMEELEPKGLRFIRLLPPDFSSKLVLPSDFAKRIKTRATEPATLISPIGRIWRVDCYQEIDGVYIRGASWREFVHANKLKVGYVLVLHHKGNMVFSFRAFDLSTREIAYSSVIIPKVQIEEEDLMPNNFAEQKSKEAPLKKRKNEVILHAGHGRSAEKMMQMQGTQTARFEVIIEACNLNRRRCCLHIPARFKKSCTILKGHDEVTVEDPTGRIWSIALFHCNRSHTIYMSDGWLEFARANELKEGNKCIFELVSQANSSKMNMSVVILSSNPIVRPPQKLNVSSRKGSNASGTTFQAAVGTYNLHSDFMHIPCRFMRSNGLTECTVLKLRDPDGQMWPVGVYYRYKPHCRANFSNGWRDLARANRLEVGDRCIFELVSDDDQENIVLQVQILKKRQLKLEGCSSGGQADGGACEDMTAAGGTATGSSAMRFYVRRGKVV